MPRALTPGGGLLVISMVLLVGCSLPGSSDSSKPSSKVANEIDGVVRELGRATRRRDFVTVCRRLFTANARRRSGGRQCPRLLRSTAEGIRRPRIELLAIKLKKQAAEAKVRTTAAGQAPLEDTIVLVRERGRYRIQSLGD